MNKYFTGLAAGAVLAFGLSGCGNYNDYDERIASLSPESSNPVSQENIPPERKYFGKSPLGLLSCSDTLYNKDSEEKEKKLLCEWAVADLDRRRPISRVFQEAYNPPAAYAAWERERMEAAVETIASHPYIAETYNQWKPPAEYQDERDALDQHAIKQKTLQIMSDTIRGSFGLAPIPVRLFKFPKATEKNTGEYNGATNEIEINYDPRWYTTVSFSHALETMTHEVKHSIDTDMAIMLATGVMPEDDIRAQHAAAIWLNERNYVPLSVDFDGYEKQYAERIAFGFESYAALIDMKVHCQDNRDPLLCLHKKFTMPL